MRDGKEKETWHERMREPLCGAPCSRSCLRIHVRSGKRKRTVERAIAVSTAATRLSKTCERVKSAKQEKESKKKEKER